MSSPMTRTFTTADAVELVEPDDVSDVDKSGLLTDNEKRIFQMRIGHPQRLQSVASKVLAQDGEVLVHEEGERPKVLVGSLDGKPVYLMVRKSGGGDPNKPGEKPTYLPELSDGRQLNILGTDIVFVTNHFSLQFWEKIGERREALGLHKAGMVQPAWKRWLVRFWHHMYSTGMVPLHSGRSKADKARSNALVTAAGGTKRGRGKRRSRKDEVVEEEDDEGLDAEVVERQQEILRRHKCKKAEEIWIGFNKDPGIYDLRDEETGALVRKAWIWANFPEDINLGRHTGPPLDVLKAAQISASASECTIELSVEYRKWLCAQTMGSKAKVAILDFDSLPEHERKKKLRKEAKAKEAKAKEEAEAKEQKKTASAGSATTSVDYTSKEAVKAYMDSLYK